MLSGTSRKKQLALIWRGLLSLRGLLLLLFKNAKKYITSESLSTQWCDQVTLKKK